MPIEETQMTNKGEHGDRTSSLTTSMLHTLTYCRAYQKMPGKMRT